VGVPGASGDKRALVELAFVSMGGACGAGAEAAASGFFMSVQKTISDGGDSSKTPGVLWSWKPYVSFIQSGASAQSQN
jgi:hypothetical protein